MNFAALPPEVNSALMYTGAGSGPMLAAAAAWDAMAAELESAASAYQSVIAELSQQSWQGPASTSMVAAAAPYAAWMSTTAAQAGQAGTQAKAAAAAYETAFAMTVPPPVIAANRAQLAALVATNFLGQNAPAIAATEALYGEMWAQDAAAMYGYAGNAAAATTLTSFTAPKNNTNPGGLANQTASALQTAGATAGTHAHTAASQLAGAVPQTLQGLSQPTGAGQLAGAAAAPSEVAISPGLAIDIVAAGFEVATVAPFGSIGLGGAFGGLALTLGSMAFPEEVESLGGLGLVGGIAPAGGSLAGFSGAGAPGAAWATMAKATPLGSLSVPQAWAAAAPSALRPVALAAAESTAGAASAVAAGASEAPFAEMALASMAGRAMAGSAAPQHRERAGTTTRQRAAAPPKPPDDAPTPDEATTTEAAIVAELRGLAELRGSGLVTEEEFHKHRGRLLDGLTNG